MTAAILHKALDAWGMPGAQTELVAQRENRVYRAQHGGRDYALRLHRPGYQSTAMIQSELAWMQHLGSQGMRVPTPLPARDGTLSVEVGETPISLLTWLDGQPLGATGTPLDLPDRTGTFFGIGEMMARMHLISDDWARPQGFARQHWDSAGLLGEAPLWGRFWENPGLSPDQRAQIIAARDRLRNDLQDAGDYGLIHADLVRENVMVEEASLGLIDFDDSGFGFRLFDVATTLFKNRSEPDYADLEAAFLEGYRRHRALDTRLLPQFTLIRALSYLGWIMPRMAEAGAEARQARFLAASLPLVTAYLR